MSIVHQQPDQTSGADGLWIDEIEPRSNLTRSQFLIWMGQKLAARAPLYNMAFAYRLTGSLDRECFETAFRALVAGAYVLRTVIEEHNGVPRQTVLESCGGLDFVDLSACENPERAYRNWVTQRAERHLQMDRCLYDSVLVRIGDGDWVWYFNQHHIVTDAASAALLCRRMATAYAAAVAGYATDAPMPAFQTYVTEERQSRETRSAKRARAFWTARVNEPPGTTRFYGAPASAGSLRTDRHSRVLGEQRTAALRAVAAEHGVRLLNPDLSLFSVFATIVLAYLQRIDGTPQRRVLGAPVHNRATKALKETPGLFIEALPFAVEIEAGETFDTLLAKVAREIMTGFAHAQPGVSTAQSNRAYDVLLNFITTRMPAFAELDVATEWVHPGYGDANHKLRLQVHDFDGSNSLQLDFDLDRDVFSDETAALAVEHFIRTIDAFLDDRSQPIAYLPLADAEELQRHVVRFNDTDTPFPRDQTLAGLFNLQVQQTPDAVAVRCVDQALSYAELATRVRRLAAYLDGLGVGPGTLTAVMLERSVDAIVAILAVLHTGGAYLPLDPRHPKRRRAQIVDDVSSSELGPLTVVLTDSNLAVDLPAHPGRTVCIDTLDLPQTELQRQQVGGETLAYVIYTSGSTGTPKGTLIPQRAAINYVSWAARQYCDGDRLAFALHTSLAVDLTVTSIFVPLTTGGEVVIYPDEGDADIPVLRVFKDDAVDVIKLTPAHLALIGEIGGRAQRIRTLILGGEDLKSDLVRTVLHQFPDDTRFYNEYGPTEATVGCMLHRFDEATDHKQSVGIGRPIANARVYVLDERLDPMPAGIPGEICIGGVGVASGYLNRVQQTAERFVSDPFVDGAVMYRTGDLGRWSTDGDLEFLGRADNQVKLRGSRVELGEVEAALAAHPDIRSCVTALVGGAEARSGRPCVKCGLPSSYPGVVFNDEDVCNLCVTFDRFAEKAQEYFRPVAEFDALAERIKATSRGDYDCLVLLSGGKDSTYMVYQLIARGLRVLSFTLDNGYISDGAKENIRRTAQHMGFDHVFATAPGMNNIFRDSLERFANVCQGCFKTIYTLSMELAREKGIGYIVTGLSRGQIFETRLDDLFRNRIFDIDAIERSIVEARKVYHRVEDAVTESLDTTIFDDDTIFDEVRFVDFYRYCEVELEELYRFLDKEAPWVRPADTGRSTNCLINDAGIYVHKRDRGYHNYALPYSWDVRLGHKNRDAALEELDDEIDPRKVHRMLEEVGYELKPARTEARLAAFYVADDALPASNLRDYLGERLPAEMVPAHFVHLHQLPLDAGGKVDRRVLQSLEEDRVRNETQFVAPAGETEAQLATVWAEVLGVERVGRHDNFIELGGDSILTIQVVARANEAGLRVTAKQMFDYPTVAELASVAGTAVLLQAEQGAVTGPVPLSPIQRWFLDQDPDVPAHWNQSMLLEAKGALEPTCVETALTQLIEHHDALRMRLECGPGGWQQTNADVGRPATVEHVDLAGLDAAAQDAVIRETTLRLESGLVLEDGELIRAAVFSRGPQSGALFLTAHHLVVDAVSWPILLRDFENVYSAVAAGETPRLPAKTLSFKQWSETLAELARSGELRHELEHWSAQLVPGAVSLPIGDANTTGTMGSARSVSVALEEEHTRSLLHNVHGAYNTRADDLLLAALTQAIGRWAGAGAVLIDIEGHGREDQIAGGDLSRTVGWFTALYPVRLPLPNVTQAADAGQLLKTVKERLRATPRSGIGYGLLRYPGQHDGAVALAPGVASQIRFNYLGQLDRQLSGSTLFAGTHGLLLSSAPANRRSHALDIAAFVADGCLRMEWNYDAVSCSEETVTRLATDHLDALRALIAHCLSPQAGGYTPSDFPEAGLDQDDLDDILSEFRE